MFGILAGACEKVASNLGLRYCRKSWKIKIPYAKLIMSVYFSLTDAFYIPKPILCGGFEQLLQDAVVWFSSGGTKSVLHSDGIDNINCIFDGTKEMVFFDKV